MGPTAVGKSDLAIDLAEMIDAEIVSADSMQVYVGMDIGTAKVTEADRRGVPHHMIDVWDPGHDVSVVEFRDRAREAIEDIEGRGRPVIIVGGSWQYVQAILDELDFPGTDPQVRARLEAELAEHGAAAMHARLAALDAVAAQAILPTNGRRIVRALEVVELEGSFTARLPEPTPWRRARWIGLAVDRLLLDARIAARVDRMWAEGFVDEVRALRSSMGRTARGALGYRQVLDALETDEDLEVARQRTIDGTRKFARRQERRFRQDARVTWVAAGITAADLL
ncbi:MAG: tRNA (adenosine(37)-N6)-dimethylallyltransferase MiaA [Candidatus Nanopelagicales bacterium]